MLPNFLLMDLGMAVSFSTIAVPDLLNAAEGLSLNETQASWFGSLSFLTQPIGALLSGPIVDYLGRKRASIVVNIPHVVAWLLAYLAWDVPSLFIANALLGIGTGLMEAPITSYISEISEPSLRGALTTVTQLFFAIGTLNIYYLGTVVNWRHAALISLAAPILATIFSLIIPETPVWLLSKNRVEEALRSLRYLRGWTSDEKVKAEFDELVVHSKDLYRCNICLAEDRTRKVEECTHININIFKRYFITLKHAMFVKETMRPLSMILLYFLFYEMSSLTPIRPNMVNLFRALGMPDDGKHIVLLACMSPNLLLLDLGMAVSFATIAMPELLNASEGLSLTNTEASWFGSIAYLTQPLGAIISGPLVDYFGRKKANFLANIPHLVAWILMHFAWNVPTLFIANGLLGLGTGVMEAPVNSYVGEISEPSIRGALCTVTQMFTSIGVLIIYFLGTVIDWRTAALICLSAPLGSMLFILFVPDTPVWLLSQGREKDALKSLCYLRGWASPDEVRDEYDKFVVYAKNLNQCIFCEIEGAKFETCEHYKMNMIKKYLLKFRYVMLCKETLRPLILVMMFFMFYAMSGFLPIRPNMVNVCGAFGMADDGKNIALMVGIITFITSVVIIGIIKVAGKRKLAITAMLGTAFSCTALSIYAKTNLSTGVFSYDKDTFPEESSVVPLAIFYILIIFTGINIPWVLLGEVFPFRSRASAQGFAAAWNYIITFVGAKTFINLETYVHLWGAFAVYAGFGFIGTIFLYFFLPETEGKTLHEIECYYNGKLRIFANDPVINTFKKFRR